MELFDQNDTKQKKFNKFNRTCLLFIELLDQNDLKLKIKILILFNVLINSLTIILCL